MRIADLLLGAGPSFSFEFFPPKTENGIRRLMGRIEHLAELRPSFVSITYGAGGGNREKTIVLAAQIRRETGLEVMAHLTCVGNTRDELLRQIDLIGEAGIPNILAIRGDRTPNVSAGDLRYASDLIALVNERAPHLCIGAACYPELHPESPDRAGDLLALRIKQGAGASFLVSQLFYENSLFQSFLQEARASGVSIPIVPGLMPMTNLNQVERISAMCGAKIPDQLVSRMERWREEDQAVMALGIEWSIRQGRELLAMGAPGLHFYTLNNSLATRLVHVSVAGRGQ